MSESRTLKHGGIWELLRIAMPLIMASSSHAMRLFSDRIMLAQLSSEALAASLSAGLMSFMFMSFFLGVVNYTSTFVAQYTGAKRPHQVGPAVWQGFFLALGGGVILGTGAFWGAPLFRLVGHDPAVQVEQMAYFQIVSAMAGFPLVVAALNAFWRGRGKTWIVLMIEGSTVVLNILLNYLLIFGHYGFPRLGIAGAALATGLSSLVGCILAASLLLAARNRREFHTWPVRKWDPVLMKRLLQYGMPNGIHFFLDISAFNLFTILFGWLGKAEQEAAAIAFSMNAIAFIPMIGIGITVSILVGQAIGAQNLAPARRAVHSAMTVVLLYMGTIGLLFVFKPMLFVNLFMRGDGADQARAMSLAADFLKYIAAYLLFDGLFIVYNSAIKGAGDTRFAMVAGVTLAWALMVLPCLVAYRLGAGPHLLWGIFICYVMISGLVFFARYRAGHWTSMSVIG